MIAIDTNLYLIEKLIMAEVVAVAADTEAGALLRTVNVSCRKVSLLNAFVVGIGCLRGRGGWVTAVLQAINTLGIVTAADIDSADNSSKSPREVAGQLYAEMALENVAVESKAHFEGSRPRSVLGPLLFRSDGLRFGPCEGHPRVCAAANDAIYSKNL